MKTLLLTAACVAAVLPLQAQFDRVNVNVDPLEARTITRAAGDNDFISVVGGELYHVTFDGEEFIFDWIENSIFGIHDFVFHDIDRDGDGDVICYQKDQGGFHVYEKRDGKFFYRPDWNIDSSKPHYLHVQDFNDDGFEDLMINHGIYVTTGPNARERVLRYPLLNSYFYDNAHFLDYDSDGDTDILLHQIHRLWVLINRGTDVTVQDLDLDETNDRTEWFRVVQTTAGEKIFYYDRNADMIKELTFQDSATYTLRDIVGVSLDAERADVAVQDLDGDGNEEIVINSYNGRKLIVFSYDPDSDTGTIRELATGSSLPRAFDLFAYQGQPAAFIGKDNEHQIYTFNDTLQPELQLSREVSIIASDNGFKDFDGDGYVDIISGNKFKPYLGDGNFGEIKTITWPDLGGNLQDVDQDGDQDYVVREGWYPNIGNCNFGAFIEIPDSVPVPNIVFTKELLRADIDQDGDIDFLTYNFFGEPLELIENLNNNTFADPVTLATSDHIGGNTVYAEVLDADGDGDNDIVMAAVFGMIILKNQGGLNFDPPVSLYPGDNKPLQVAQADINSDGLPDFLLGTRNIVAGSALGEVLLYLGTDTIPQSRLIEAGSGYHRVAVGDIDGAGWTDLIFHNRNGITWAGTEDGQAFYYQQVDGGIILNGVLSVQDVDNDNDDDIILYDDGDPDIYYYLNDESIIVPATCPEGDVFIRNSEQLERFAIRYPFCDKINGTLFIGKTDNDWSDIGSYEAFMGVKEITGDLNLWYNNAPADLRGFDSLHTIGGSLLIDGHKSSSFAGIENLRRIGGDLNFRNVATIGGQQADLTEFVSLDTIGGSLIIRQSFVTSINSMIQSTFYGDVVLDWMGTFKNTQGFSQIDTILGALLIRDTGVETLDIGNISYLGGLDVTGNTYLYALTAPRSTKHIPGDVRISGNIWLGVLEGLDSLRRTGGSLSLAAQAIPGLELFEKAGDDVQISAATLGEKSFMKMDSVLDRFSISSLEAEDLSQFAGLRSIGELSVANTTITSLNGLQGINDTLASISISRNRQLEHLEDLKETLIVNGRWSLWQNDRLNACDAVPLCRHIAEGRETQIFDNGIDCSDISSIRCVDNAFSGFVYHDFNENMVLDANEARLANIKVHFDYQELLQITSDNGYYITHVLSGDSIKSRVEVPDAWAASGPSEIVIDSFISGESGNYGNNFGLVPQFEKRDFTVTINEGLFICNRPYELMLDVHNDGTFIEFGELKIYYPEGVTLADDFTDFIEHDLEGRVITLLVDSLYPFFSQKYAIPFFAPDEFQTGEDFTTRIELYRSNGPGNELVFQEESTTLLRCSFDPNDKLVKGSSGSQDIIFTSDKTLTYTIRFQNTGNLEANTVRLVDTLDAILDISTFEFLSASHPVQITLDGRILHFFFYDIMLPDSATDFTGSQGYVTFNIKPWEGIALGDEIFNDADIYFDYNSPILTNKVKSSVIKSTSTVNVNPSGKVALYPVPASDRLNVLLEPGNHADLLMTILDLNGKPLATANDTRTLDIRYLPAGVYLLQVRTSTVDYGMHKFVKVAK